jgi:hypothetical protein
MTPGSNDRLQMLTYFMPMLEMSAAKSCENNSTNVYLSTGSPVGEETHV